MTKFLNISVDNTLGGNSPSDVLVSSQKAVKEYVDNHGGGGGSVSIDNVTITKNTNDELQASGIINKNENTGAVSPLGIWNGTETQWNQGEATTWYNWVNASASSSAKTLPSTNDWRNAIYDGTRMIVVSNSSSTFLYSTDGTNWSSGNIKISNPYQLAVGNGVWLAIPSSSQTASRSTNGTSWSTITTPRGSTGIVYGNDKFVSTANGYFMYSADGLSWTDLGFIAGATYIAYGNGLYVTTGGSKSLYSTDGINWNTGTTSIGSYGNICYGADKFVALPFSDGNSIAYTTDGDTWTIVDNAMPYTQSWGSITYGNGIFVATGYNTANAAYSYDGITWHGFSMPSSAKWFGAVYNGSDFYTFGYQTNKAAKITIGTWECFTTDESPTTSSVVYDAKSVVSTKTITSVGTGTITLSDSKTYNYNPAGNQFDYRSIGEAHPDWLCNINGVGVKIGTTMIADQTGTLPTVNDATLTINQGGTLKGTFTANASSNVTIDLDAGGGGSVDIDNKSITTNLSDEIQTVGVINSRDSSTAIKTWTGTKAQYDAIVTKDANTLYNITDDTDVSLTILEALYPVGSIYITTANTCPLSALISGSTWTLVSSGKVLQGADSGHSAGTSISAGLPNITGAFSPSTLAAQGGASGSGALTGSNSTAASSAGTGSSHNCGRANFVFDASKSNSIYGNSTTVQPPAYVVNIFERIA